MPALTRGQLIRTGAAGAALLALASCTRSSAPRSGYADGKHRYRMLSDADRELFAAVVAAMLASALPSAAAERQRAVVETVRGVDVAIAGLTPRVAGQLQQLFGLLEFAPARGLTAGVWTSWVDATPGEVARFLTRWRFSSVALFRSGYQALHQLVMAAWYGNSASWNAIAYPGPPAIP